MPRTLLSLLCTTILVLFATPRAVATDPLQAFMDAPMRGIVPTIESVLGHSFGERFTRHDQLLNYCEAVAESSDRVRLDDYGKSHLGRRLVTLTVTSPANHDRLDEILAANRALADPDSRVDSSAMQDNSAIVWFSFSVHGNEASNSEAALALLYALAASESDEVASWLDDVVVVIDPCLNPDGRERYVSWFETMMGQEVNSSTDAAERFEPWPGGRTNHYMFDLNRDWVWGVQPESRSRVAWYLEYMPQLHVDWHEQGAHSPTFFGEGDTPYSANIPQSTKDWVADYTVAVAESYDELGLVFATRERFDYLYPGYGKVLPCYHGAVGILNEQGGHSRGGLSIEISDEYDLTLAERIRNQLVIAKAYIEQTADQREGQLDRFRDFFAGAMDLSDAGTAGFMISSENTAGQLDRVWRLAQMHGIKVYETRSDTTLDDAIASSSGETIEGAEIGAGSWWIPVDQPMGRLVLTLFERSSEIEDPDTYDITGWSVPVMFGLDCWSVSSTPSVRMRQRTTAPVPSTHTPEGGMPTVATVIPSDQWDFTVALGIAAKHNLFARLTGEDFTVGDDTIPAGSLLIHSVRTDEENYNAFIEELDGRFDIRTLDAGLTDSGPVLGANANRRFVLPKVMLPRGDAFSSYSFGQVWHMLDVAYPLPHTVVPAERMGSVETSSYNVLVLPEGRPGAMMDADTMKAWVRGGGTVVALGSSALWASRELLDLSTANADDDRPKLSELSYAEREDRSVEDRIPGAVFRAIVDTTHPITFGVTDEIGVIKRSSTPLPVSDSGYVIARFAEEPVVGGSVSDRNAERIAGTPFVTHHRLGGGNVICFSDDITLRGFNHAGMRLLINTIAKGPSFARSLQPLGEDHEH